MRPVLTFLALLLTATPALAGWKVFVDEDPLDDTKTAFLAARNDGASLFSAVTIGVKCWQGKPESTLVVISTRENWDATAEYREEVEVTLRIDKGAPMELRATPANASGYFSLVSYSGLEPKVMDFLGQLGDAKKQIGLGFGGLVLRFSARGTTAGVKKLIETCGLVLPAPEQQ